MFATPRTRKRLIPLGLIAVPLLVIGLAACSPTAGDDTAASSGTTKMTLTEWQLEFAECMRAEGVDMPDPSGAGGAHASTITGDPEVMQAASAKCQEKLGNPPAMSPEEQAASDEAFMSWARDATECYREKGYDMEDPEPGTPPQFPADAPEDVMQECGGAISATHIDD